MWQGRLFTDFGNQLIGKLANQPLAFENHKHGLAVADFSQYLAPDYLLLSTSKDRDDAKRGTKTILEFASSPPEPVVGQVRVEALTARGRGRRPGGRGGRGGRGPGTDTLRP